MHVLPLLITLFLFFHSLDAAQLSPRENPSLFQTACDGAIYIGAGTALETASVVTFLGAQACHLCCQTRLENECLLVSQLCNCAAKKAFERMVKYRSTPSPLTSWHLNQTQLSTLPAPTLADQNLLLFLQKRWLAKSAGFYSGLIDWVCPCFGVAVQVHPQTSSTYARDPYHKCPLNYSAIVASWKSSLPHPPSFPLLLTRPFSLKDYFPAYLEVAPQESLDTTLDNLRLHMRGQKQPILVDLSAIFDPLLTDPQEWLKKWQSYKIPFLQKCQERHLNVEQILCLQKVSQGQVGGMRILPLLPDKDISETHQEFILQWISTAGLSANRVELDRFPLSDRTPNQPSKNNSKKQTCKTEFAHFLSNFEEKWTGLHPQKNLMLQGTLQVLKGLLHTLPESTWQQILDCPTRLSIAALSFEKIEEHLKYVADEKDLTFFDFVASLEQVHAHLSALLEIFSPFEECDFAPLYCNLLTKTPAPLRHLTKGALHASAMTSLTGVMKLVEKNVGRKPLVLYGENTYFENIFAAKEMAEATPSAEATENQLKECDLILSQFNPALKRFNCRVNEHCVENVSALLHKTLQLRQGKPLTVAFDCTFDFIDSPRLGILLAEFQQEIETGLLNIVCYRSGLKFDLFGMDNYCGAPFYMIHNEDPKWKDFDALIEDPVLQTDRLSCNWFCLAYQHAAPFLELYRKQIFDNTRALLDRIPSSLYDAKSAPYRVIPIESQADPAFVDVKIYGKGHELRGALIVGGLISMECMENKHPLFYRQSLGFYHPNFSLLFFKDWTTLRLTLGLDPAQVPVIVNCFKTISHL